MCHRWFTGRATKQAGTELWARGLPAGAFEGAIASPVYAVCRANSSTCSHSMSHGARDGAHRRIHLRNQVASRGAGFPAQAPALLRGCAAQGSSSQFRHSPSWCIPKTCFLSVLSPPPKGVTISQNLFSNFKLRLIPVPQPLKPRGGIGALESDLPSSSSSLLCLFPSSSPHLFPR